MRNVYPVILTPSENGYVVYVPDFDVNTEGSDLGEALYMARDVICTMGLVYHDEKKPYPEPKTMTPPHQNNEIVSLVDVDFDAYRIAHERRSIRTNVTLPAWLKSAADEQGISLSATLQKGLKEQLHIKE